MGLSEVRQAVKAFLAAQWSATEVTYENDGYQPQEDADGALIAYVAVELVGGLVAQQSIGAGDARSNYWTASGQVWLHVTVAAGSGADMASQLADSLVELFRGIELEPGIVFADMNVAASGGQSDGSAWMLSVAIDWTQD
jgi:hypothetical protein